MSYNYKIKITPELLLLAATILKVVVIFNGRRCGASLSSGRDSANSSGKLCGSEM